MGLAKGRRQCVRFGTNEERVVVRLAIRNARHGCPTALAASQLTGRTGADGLMNTHCTGLEDWSVFAPGRLGWWVYLCGWKGMERMGGRGWRERERATRPLDCLGLTGERRATFPSRTARTVIFPPTASSMPFQPSSRFTEIRCTAQESVERMDFL